MATLIKNTALTFVAYKRGPSIIGHVTLYGDRTLRVTFQASRELRAEMRGDISLTKKNQNLELYAGDSKYLDFIATDNGAAVDLTGVTIKWVMKRFVSSASNDVYKDTIGGGVSITDAANGKFTVTIAPSDTKTLAVGTYYHEAEVTDALGNVSTVTVGKVTLIASGV